MENNSKRFSWTELLLGIIYVIVAFIAFNNPIASLLSIVYVFGMTMIFGGITALIARNSLKERFGFALTGSLILAILRIFFGILILFNVEIGFITIPILFALWFITESITAIVLTRAIKPFSTALYWIALIIAIFSLIIGLYLLFTPVATLAILPFLVGMYFLTNGFKLIVAAFV
jgi:uncharacterized membrane protein HdeD (DUF308 family)